MKNIFCTVRNFLEMHPVINFCGCWAVALLVVDMIVLNVNANVINLVGQNSLTWFWIPTMFCAPFIEEWAKKVTNGRAAWILAVLESITALSWGWLFASNIFMGWICLVILKVILHVVVLWGLTKRSLTKGIVAHIIVNIPTALLYAYGYGHEITPVAMVLHIVAILFMGMWLLYESMKEVEYVAPVRSS